MIPKYTKEWLKKTEYQVWCDTDCPHLKKGFCTYYQDELTEENGRYFICKNCYDDCHAEV